MVIFHSYVKLPEGIYIYITKMYYDYYGICALIFPFQPVNRVPNAG